MPNQSQFDPNATAAVLAAAATGDVETIAKLVGQADLTATDSGSFGFHKKTALMIAASGGHAECVRLLLPGSDQLANNGMGNALIYAIRGRKEECANLLLSAQDGAEAAKASDSTGQTTVMLAALSHSKMLIERLLPLVDANARDDYGRNAFGNAILCNLFDAARMLAPVSDFAAKDKAGRSFMDDASEEQASAARAIMDEELARRESVELAAALPKQLAPKKAMKANAEATSKVGEPAHPSRRI